MVMAGDDDWENSSLALMGCNFSDNKRVESVDSAVEDDDAATLGCFKEADLISSNNLFLSTPLASVAQADPLEAGEDTLPIDLLTKEELLSSEPHLPPESRSGEDKTFQPPPSSSSSAMVVERRGTRLVAWQPWRRRLKRLLRIHSVAAATAIAT